ncbi:MAG: tetratricopeptide repeat protein, partial [Bacteroidales bacterium]|nr:tetratricopeptide repeat protein [Bacteroidales bacterium]
MESVKLCISNFEEQHRNSIAECLKKCNNVFRHKGFIIELDNNVEVPQQAHFKEIAGSLIYTEKEGKIIVCEYNDIDTLALLIILGAGTVVEYNIPDVTDIKDGKLAIDLEELVNFSNVKTFSEHPCISELKDRIAQFPETEEETLLKEKSDMVSNLRRYYFMVFNWLNFIFNFDNSRLNTTPPPSNREEVDLALNAYERLFNTRNPIAQRIEQSMATFEEAIELSGKKDDKNCMMDLLKAYSEVLVVFEKYKEAEAVLDKYHSIAAGIDLTNERKRAHQVIVCHNYKSVLYYEQQKFDLTIENYNMVIALTEKLFGKEHIDIIGYKNLIASFYELQGKYDKAIELLYEILERQIEVYGIDSDAVAITYNNLGFNYHNKGDFNRAEDFYKKSLALEGALTASTRHITCVNYVNLGGLYENNGEYEKALEYHKKALEISKVVYGENHYEVALIYNNLGTDFLKLGKYRKAIENYNKALKLRLGYQGEKSESVANIYSNISSYYDAVANYPKALQNLLKALEIQKK